MDACAAGLFCDWIMFFYLPSELQSLLWMRKCTSSVTVHLQTQENYSNHYNAQTHWCIFYCKYAIQWLGCKENSFCDFLNLSVYYSCSVALVWTVWAAGYNSAGERTLLHRQQQELQKEWLMLLSHIQYTDRYSDKMGEEKKFQICTSTACHAHMYTCTHTLLGVRIFSLNGGGIANGRKTLISWGMWNNRKLRKVSLNKYKRIFMEECWSS